MIYFKKDWHTPSGQRRAVVHYDTSNKSFIRIAVLLKKLGVKNYLFPLALVDPSLAEVRPHELENPPANLAMRISEEIRINVWYYFREIVRLPMSGGAPMQFEAHRGNIAMIWCYMNNIDYIGIQPRQTGKTVCAIAISSYVIYFHGYNIRKAMLTKDVTLLQENVSRLKAIREALPKWLVSKSLKDEDNKEGLFYFNLKNKYETYVGRTDVQGADNLGRGMSPPTIHIDEIGFVYNIHITYPVLMMATSDARKKAAMNNKPHSNIYTTTAARTSTTEGKFAHKLVTSAMPFTESLYDCEDNAAAKAMVKVNSKNNLVNGTWSYLQLGKSHEWFIEEAARSEASQDAIDRDLLNMWNSGSNLSVIPIEILKKMEACKKSPSYVQSRGTYAFYWYRPEEEVESIAFRKRSFVLSLDASQAEGNDYFCMVLLDPQDMSVVATFRCNEANTHNLAHMITKFLLEFPNVVFIPERKSTAIGVIDTVISTLIHYGINVYSRIFNKFVQEASGHIKLDSSDLEESSDRKSLGFMTAAKSRSILYGTVMTKATRMNAERMYDSVLINEFSGLEIRNGRIDHGAESNDDMVIAYLLCCYLIYEGKNLYYYGIDVDSISSADRNPDQYKLLSENANLKRQIESLERAKATTTVETVRRHFDNQIAELKSRMTTSVNLQAVSHDQLISGISKYGSAAYETASPVATSYTTQKPFNVEDILRSIV